MAGAREIRTKIKSVANTRKVTRALEMVSASKIRKAQDLMRASRPYARAMRQVIGHIAHATAEYKHPFMVTRQNVKRVGYVVISTDRGLCGGLNANLFRRLLVEIPMGFTDMLSKAPALALAWRLATREIFTTCFGRGYRAVEFFLDRPARKGAYLLVRA